MVVPGHGKVGGPDILEHTIGLVESAANKLKQSNIKEAGD